MALTSKQKYQRFKKKQKELGRTPKTHWVTEKENAYLKQKLKELRK